MSDEASASSLASGILEEVRQLRNLDVLGIARKSFNLVHGALDVIGDTDVAIGEFSIKRESGNLGKEYLLTYGLFQALQTQQDAVWALCDSISIPENSIKEDLSDIRRLRALTVAHPTDPHPNNKEDKASRTGIISRGALLGGKFGFMTTFDDGRPSEFKEVNLTQLIDRQSKYVAEVLGRVRDELVRRKEEHYKEFGAVKLAEVFHPAIDWMMGHVEEALDDKEKRPIANADLIVIEGYLKRYIDLLRERGIQNENHIVFSVQRCLHAHDRLRKYFENSESNISKTDAEIFANWLRSKLQELKSHAESLDRKYENKLII